MIPDDEKNLGKGLGGSGMSWYQIFIFLVGRGGPRIEEKKELLSLEVTLIVLLVDWGGCV